MTATQGELAALSRYIIRTPNWPASITFALVLAAVIGVGAFDSNYILEDAYQGIFYIGLPTLVASFLTPPIDRWLGGQFTYNRSSLLALTSEVIVVVFLSVAGILAVLTPLGQHFVFDVLLTALAIIFAFRLLVVMAISHPNPLRATIPASLQTLTAAILLFVYSGTLRFLEIGGPLLDAYLSRPEQAPEELLLIVPQDFAVLAVMCLLYSATVWGLVYLVDRPWRRSLGISGFDFLRGFIGHVAEGSRELEEVFEQIGEEAIVPVTVLAFQRQDGTEKARFVLPMIHPGPMGEIGGGNLPERIAREADGLAFPPHATAGHDFNLVTEKEVETLLEAAERAHDRIRYRSGATKSIRCTAGEASLLGQAFGNDTLLVTTFSPGFADDIEFGVGLSTMAEARSAGADNILLVDAHNCNNGLTGEDLGHVTPGSKRSFDLFQAASQCTDRLVNMERSSFELGVAWDRTQWTPTDGIGALGIRVAVFAVNGQETAYILIDGNNMEPGLRDRIVDTIDIDEAEVMTTDTHIVNTVESVNQVGEAIDQAELVERITHLVEDARADCEPVTGGMATERATVTIFGNDRTETLASHANAVITMSGPLVAAVVLATMAISILIFLFAGL